MAPFAWIPLFLLQLFSTILGMDLHYIPAFNKIEVLRWHQPICTSASPCHTYQSRYYDVDQVQKVLNVREVRESIDIDELEPSTLDWPVIYEKLYAPEHSEDARSKRHFNGRYLPNDPPPAILVTRVIDSPVTATITGRNCIDGVPSCVDGPTRVPIQLSPEQERGLPRAFYNSVVQSLSLSDAIAGQTEFVEKYAKKKDAVVQQIIDEVSHKKDAVVNAVEGMKQSIVDGLSQKKDAIVGAVTSAAATKHQFVQGIIDKKKEKVQPIIDLMNEKKDKIVGVVAGVAAVKYGYVKPVVEKVEEKKEQIVAAVSNATAAKKEFVEGIVKKKEEKIQAVVDKVEEKKEQIVAAVSSATASKKEFVEGVHEKLQEKKDKIVEILTNATTSKKEFVEGIVEKKHEKLQEKKDKIVEILTNATASKKEFVEGIVEKKHEMLQKKKDEVIAAVYNATAIKQKFVEGIVEMKKEKLQQKKEEIAQIKDSFSTLPDDKQAAIQKVINKTKHVIHEFEQAKEKAEQDLAQKKQEFIQSVADKKIAAIKHVSEKAQEYIGTASLAKPLIKSQIKQMFNKNEEEIERKTDDGDDFVFVDEDGNDEPVEQTQGRTIGLFKKFTLKKKFEPVVAHNDSTEATTIVEEPAHPVLTQQAESTIPEANNPTEKQETVSSTTEKVVSVIENHEVSAVGPTGIEAPEQVATSSSHEENEASSSAHAFEEVPTNVDTPTTVANNVAYVPAAVNPIPATPVVVNRVPMVQITPVVVHAVPVVPAIPPAIPCQNSYTVKVSTSGNTFTFGAGIAKSGKNDIEAANVTEDTANVHGTGDVDGKNAQVDFDEIVPKNADVDEFIAHLLSKLVSDEDVAANSDGVFAKNAGVDDVDSGSANEEVVAKNVAAEAEAVAF